MPWPHEKHVQLIIWFLSPRHAPPVGYSYLSHWSGDNAGTCRVQCQAHGQWHWDKVFVGGGLTDSLNYGDDERTVYEYDEDSNQWVSLPLYDCWRFVMTILTDKLTLVGGVSTFALEVTNQVAVWEGEGTPRGWTHPYPPMTTPRSSPAVATYGDRLVVAGGYGHGVDLATVEVLNTTSHQWLSAAPLPMGCHSMASAIVNQELFLLGGSLTTVSLVVSLPDITRSSVHSTTTNRSVQWRSLPAPPLERSAAMSLRAHGSLLAIGGSHVTKSDTAIHVYQPATNNWIKVGDLPSPRSRCSCALLPSGEILVAGGVDSNGKRASRVDAATFWLCLIPRTV